MEQLIGAILAALEQAGITAARQFPAGRLPHLTAPVTAVGLKAARGTDGALFSYLGKTVQGGKELELYGRELKAEVLLQSVCPRRLGAAACMQQTDAIVQLLSVPVSGISMTELTVGGCEFDEAADTFTMTVTAGVRAYLYALSEEDGAEFTEFILKGEVI